MDKQNPNRKSLNLLITSILIIVASWFLMNWTAEDAELMAGLSLIVFGPGIIFGVVLLVKSIIGLIKNSYSDEKKIDFTPIALLGGVIFLLFSIFVLFLVLNMGSNG